MRHMRDHAREATAMVRGRERAELDNDRQLQLSVVRLIEIVGEAANRVSRETQREYPQVAWREAVTVRNRVIHGYDLIDLDVVWEIVTSDLPVLAEALDRILAGAADGGRG